MVPLRGLVLDPVNGPVLDVLVEIVGGTFTGRRTSTDAQGRFDFGISVSEAEPVALDLSKPGYRPASARPSGDLVVVLSPVAQGDIDGVYTVTLAAAADCAQLAPEHRQRSYTGLVESVRDTRNQFTIRLTGAEFYEGYGTFWVVLGLDAARFFVFSWQAFNSWLEDLPIMERPSPNEFLSIDGTATTHEGGAATFTTSLAGTFAYCSRASFTPPLAPRCSTAPVECGSAQHQITFTRR
jgi:hypothetical protein